ncbi:MAG TPA: Arc family DNA-binding protein [Thermaerobacter sp.]
MTEKKRFLLRIDPAIYDAIQKWAADEWRSVNGQIEYLLREALRKAGRLPGPARGDRGPRESGPPSTGAGGEG